MTTSLATLTLEVYYRYLPIFKPMAMRSEEIDKRTSESGTKPKEPKEKDAENSGDEPFGGR